VKDFVPISRIATASNVLVVNNALPAKNVAELVKLAKEKPGALNYASAGVGTPAHLAGEMLNLLADIKVAHVPYKGAAPALLDVIAGNAQYIITSPIAAGAHMTSGRVRAIATTGTERNPSLPDVPTVADTLPGYEITQTWGIVVPAGTPPDVVRRLSDEIVKVLAMPDVKERVLATGASPVGDRGEAFAAYMAKERQRLGEVIAKSGIVRRELAQGRTAPRPRLLGGQRGGLAVAHRRRARLHLEQAALCIQRDDVLRHVGEEVHRIQVVVVPVLALVAAEVAREDRREPVGQVLERDAVILARIDVRGRLELAVQHDVDAVTALAPGLG
jgi:hypothetical protein